MLVCLTATAGTTAAAAQEPAPDTSEVAPGDAVRITAPALGLKKWVGVYVRADIDSVTVRAASPDSADRTLPLAEIETFDVNHGNKPARRNGQNGAAVGALGGLLVGALVASPDGGTGCLSDSEDTACTWAQARGALYGAGIGALLGAGIGALIKTVPWKEVPINPPAVTIAPASGGGTLIGVLLRF